jgi:phospholipase/carboxylesterase
MIGLHGLGDTPQLFFRAFGTDMQARARMIFVQAPTAHGNGFSWFELPGSLDAISMGSVADGIGSAGERVADLIEQLVREHAPPSRPVVFGYSQGGILGFYLAARHADEIAAAVPISGLLPSSMLDLDGTPAPTFAFHGSRDELVPLEGARATVAAFRAAGGTAELREYPHLGHRVSLALVRDAMAKLAELSSGGAAARPD